MKKTCIGIIGIGRIGQLHADNILRASNVKLKAISDVCLAEIKGTYLEKSVDYITDDFRKIIADPEIDAIFICSSTDTHVEIIKAAATSGKHVFCEKPISFNYHETEEALQVVRENNVKLQVGFNRRFDQHFRKVYESVQKGIIGEPQIIRVTSRDPEPPPASYIQRSGGLFIDMAIHDFDMMRFLSGSNVTEVHVYAANLVDPMIGELEDIDTAIISLKFANGALGVIDNSRKATYGYDQRVEVFGDKGAVSAGNERITNIEISTGESVSIDKPKHFFLERYQEAYVEEVQSFIRSIQENQPIECAGEDGLEAEILAYAARQSWLEKRTVTISEIKKSRKILSSK
ncbi:inositol 2-dehydrogenase [Bacillus sp. J14TS2]|uniref:inositol 2-dehydrogenase n=1 Tax=Bacillus sp. J14TS2 TaxID=2807188 RepID=UPI001B22A731|nr:inositol 2-dehydrogenase [Bacillus sp. J14TS2]GIN69584.1 inositol 2-dehydrogenase [Bacillus sp. J14TS2]